MAWRLYRQRVLLPMSSRLLSIPIPAIPLSPRLYAYDVALDAASVVSEPLLHVPVSAVRTQVKPESFTPEWRERGMILAEGRFTSYRVDMNIGHVHMLP